MSINSQQFGAQQYDNVDATGNWTITVVGTYACGNVVQPFNLSSATMGAGRWVLVRANAVTGWVGATVAPPTGLTAYSVSLEDVNYSGTTYKCVVVTLV